MGALSAGDIILIVLFAVGAVVAGLYFLNRWAVNKMTEQEQTMERSKQAATIYVIDKKKMHAKESNLPKVVMDNLPFAYKFLKMYLVKAKVGPQIVTLTCDKRVFNALSLKKNVKVELAGIYIASIVGMKSEKEQKEAKRAKDLAEGKRPWHHFLTKDFRK